ncbi:TPA: hypothetical protein N0F65_009224 [Lagenidium giganteum]|uniref:Myb/SANT-like domain-containing protein n=1 Tax=Lagenidium giganteum TaxID=4803 RepID=A0AAV2YR10_9STRA|nr:TPA: hypothetical protein N0F65_009224 [Lagenidium giganteum]
MGCKGKVIANKAKFIQSNKKNDWALIKLPESVDLSSYGYLQLRADGPVPHEKIYIPQHPKGWAKRIAYFVKGGNVATVTSLTAANSCGTDQVGYQADTRKSAAWTDARRLVLIRAVKKQVAKGKATDNGLKKEAWTAVLDEFNVTNGLRYTKAQLQSQWTVLKKKYTIFQSLVNNSGFGWDEDAKLPTAPAEVTQDSDKHAMHSLIGGEQVWQEYLAAHKEAKEFQSKTLKHYNDLHEIFSGSVATGEYAQGCRSSVQEVETARSTSSEDFHEDFHDSLTSREMPQSPTTSQTRSPTTSQASVNDASPAHLLPSARSSLSPRTITPAAPATPDVADGPLRKRQRSSRNQVADSLRFLATSQLKLAEIRERENVTATQLAIHDFSERFRAYPARSKIRFARHLAANENEARMYLELDEDVKIEYVNDVLDEMN